MDNDHQTMDLSRRRFLKTGLLAIPVLGFAGGRRALAGTTKEEDVIKALDDRIEFIRRDVWADASPRPRRLRASGGFDRLTVHHAGSRTNFHSDRNAVIHDLRGVLASHMERHYADIGYHFMIDYVGRVWEGRSLRYKGAHVLSENKANIGVMVLGNFEEQNVSEKQIKGLTILASTLSVEFRIPRHRIYGHRDLGASKCPGKYLYPHVTRMRA